MGLGKWFGRVLEVGWGGLYWKLGLRLMQEYESKRNKGSESDVILCLKKMESEG